MFGSVVKLPVGVTTSQSLISGLFPDFFFLLMLALGGNHDGPSTWVPAIPMEYLGRVPGAWLPEHMTSKPAGGKLSRSLSPTSLKSKTTKKSPLLNIKKSHCEC